MDAIARKTKEAELQTWQQNLAVHQAQAAQHGMAPPVSIINEIETAKRNIARIQHELDDGAEQSAEATLIGILELSLSTNRKMDGHDARLAAVERALATLEKRAGMSPTAQASRWAAALIVFVLYTSAVIKESRDAILSNPLQSAIIVILALGLAVLLRVLANLLSPVEVRNDDR